MEFNYREDIDWRQFFYQSRPLLIDFDVKYKDIDLNSIPIVNIIDNSEREDWIMIDPNLNLYKLSDIGEITAINHNFTTSTSADFGVQAYDNFIAYFKKDIITIINIDDSQYYQKYRYYNISQDVNVKAQAFLFSNKLYYLDTNFYLHIVDYRLNREQGLKLDFKPPSNINVIFITASKDQLFICISGYVFYDGFSVIIVDLKSQQQIDNIFFDKAIEPDVDEVFYFNNALYIHHFDNYNSISDLKTKQTKRIGQKYKYLNLSNELVFISNFGDLKTKSANGNTRTSFNKFGQNINKIEFKSNLRQAVSASYGVIRIYDY